MKVMIIFTIIYIEQAMLNDSLEYSKNKTIRFLNSVNNLQLDINSINNIPTVKICIGSNHQCFNCIILLSGFFSWVMDQSNPQSNLNKFDYKSSNTFRIKIERAQLTFADNKYVEGDHFEDILWFNNTQIPYTPFFKASVSHHFSNVDGILAFGYIPNKIEKNFSILHHLHMKGAVSQKVFSIEYMNEHNGKLQLGKVDESIIKDSRNYGKCFTLKDAALPRVANNKWECLLKGIQFKSIGNIYEILIKSNATFDYNVEKVIVPFSIIKGLEEKLFFQLIEKRHCKLGLKGDYYMFTCTNDEYKELQKAHLLFGDWEMIIPKERLFSFDTVEQEHEFLFVGKKSNGSTNTVIGNKVLSLFYMIFDEYNGEVGFYSTKNTFNIHQLHDKQKGKDISNKNDFSFEKTFLKKAISIYFVYSSYGS